MNDLARPALYDAWHEIVAVAPRSLPATRYEVVGPICEAATSSARPRPPSRAGRPAGDHVGRRLRMAMS